MKTILEYLYNKKGAIKSKNYKDFKDVKIGDRGRTTSGQFCIITDKGTVEEMAIRDVFGGLSECLDMGFAEKDDPAVLVAISGQKSVGYVYGPEGVIVK